MGGCVFTKTEQFSFSVCFSFVHLYDLKLNIFVSFFSINISLVIIKFSEITQRFGIHLIRNYNKTLCDFAYFILKENFKTFQKLTIQFQSPPFICQIDILHVTFLSISSMVLSDRRASPWRRWRGDRQHSHKT